MKIYFIIPFIKYSADHLVSIINCKLCNHEDYYEQREGPQL